MKAYPRPLYSFAKFYEFFPEIFHSAEWKLWSGKYDANGSYLVVKKDGEILCYHFYDQNRFEDFLFKNAYLERGKTRRHGYASLYRDEDSNVYFKLNLQIRLK